MKLTQAMKNKLPGRFFGLPRKREYPMGVIIGGKPKWDKQHAALAKGRAKQQFDRGFLTQGSYNQIVRKADRVLAMKTSRSMKANTKRRNTAVRMDTTFDDPGWKKYKRSAIKKRRATKTNPKGVDEYAVSQIWQSSTQGYASEPFSKTYYKHLNRLRSSDFSKTNALNDFKKVADKAAKIEGGKNWQKHFNLATRKHAAKEMVDYLIDNYKEKHRSNPKPTYKVKGWFRRGTPKTVEKNVSTLAEARDLIRYHKPRTDVFKRLAVYKDGKLYKDYPIKQNFIIAAALADAAARKKKKKKKKKKSRQNTTVPSGSTTGGGYMHAMRGLREGDYSKQRTGKQLNMQYMPVGYSSETGRDIVDTALIAGKRLNPKKRKKRNPSKGWFRFSMFAKSGKKLGIRTGYGTKTDADKTGKRYLGSKQKGRIVHRLVIDGPLKNKPVV